MVWAPRYGAAQTHPSARALWCISVAFFLLTRRFQGHPFHRDAWCRRKVFQVSPPLSPTYLYKSFCCVLQVHSFFFFSFHLWRKRDAAVRFRKQKVTLSVADAVLLEALSSEKKRWGLPLSCWFTHLSRSYEKRCTWLSPSRMLTGRFPFERDSVFIADLQWRLQQGKIVCIPA